MPRCPQYGIPADNNRPDLRQNFLPALGLHKLRAGGNEPFCILHRRRNASVTAIRQVRAKQCARSGAGGGADVMFHLSHRHMRRVRITEHDHAQRIADEDERYARLVEQLCHRKIVGGERGDFFAARFHGANGINRDFGGIHLEPRITRISRMVGRQSSARRSPTNQPRRARSVAPYLFENPRSSVSSAVKTFQQLLRRSSSRCRFCRRRCRPRDSKESRLRAATPPPQSPA